MRVVTCILGLVAVSTCATASLADDKSVCTDAYVAAQTLRNAHRLVEAREQLRVCARQECSANMRGQMIADCTSWLTEVESSMPSIVLGAKDAAGGDMRGEAG